MLKIASAEFLQGVVDLRQLPKNELCEIVYIGRSNVGKSSLLNKMCNKKNLARTSTVPGKTREINYYIILLICLGTVTQKYRNKCAQDGRS